jgi:acetyl-CoA synthetase
MLQPASDYPTLYRDFRWQIPTPFNIAQACCDRHADDATRLALIYVEDSGEVRRFSFRDMQAQSSRFANALTAHGLKHGDRIAVFLPQTPETAIAHLGAFRAGLVSVPLFTLFGDDALEFRLANSEAKAVVTDVGGYEKLARVRDRLPKLAHVYVTGDATPAGARSFNAALVQASDDFAPLATHPDDPAIIIYTSGTTGNPKGALHGHRVLLGHLPCIEMVHDFFPKPGDLYWTPADWAWIGGLFDALFPSWYFGVPVLAHRARKFDPEAAMRLMAEHGVRNVFLPPTAMKLMRQANVTNAGVRLRGILTGGESLGGEMLDWVRATFGIDAHEIYGQTECNLVVGNNARLFPIRAGSMGRAIPGFDVRIVDAQGFEKPRGETGIIGVRAPNPCMMLEYWKNPDATRQKYAGGFLLTGDLGRQDDEDYFWYVSREDDLITSAGYRIGPSEIENTLMKHPAVAMAAVAGVPDPIRTEAIKAWLVLRPGFAASEELADMIRAFVRERLAAHEYPRHIAFVDSLPLTATGKVLRRELRARG